MHPDLFLACDYRSKEARCHRLDSFESVPGLDLDWLGGRPRLGAQRRGPNSTDTRSCDACSKTVPLRDLPKVLSTAIPVLHPLWSAVVRLPIAYKFMNFRLVLEIAQGVLSVKAGGE